jgi:glycyl-tRNA synthetase
MFVNFRRLNEFNTGKMPMGVAQIGSAYRNEIAPRGGLLRVREFTMAEIEFFVHPEKKNHIKFKTVANMRLQLFPADKQIGDGKTVTPTLEEAVSSGVINNQTLAYYMARTALFLTACGIKPEGLRFRQHLKTEMAHYACDCWDAEIQMSQGWVECVGHADRSAFDLEVHAKATRTDLVAREIFPEPRDETYVNMKANSQAMGKAFKNDNKAVKEILETFSQEEAMAFQAKLTADGSASLEIGGGKSVTISKDMVSFSIDTRRVSERKYTPNVIEPSFGIGRILTGILEHTFYVREGEVKEGDLSRSVLALPALIAPYKAIVCPLDGRIDREHVDPIAHSLTAQGLSAFVDDSSQSIGKRYSRADELGVPFALTFDYESLNDKQVTVRERDSTKQVRLPISAIAKTLNGLCRGELSWNRVMEAFATGGGGLSSLFNGEEASSSSLTSSAAVSTKVTAAPPAAPSVAAAGTVGVKLEGTSRPYGRFSRPADL